MFYRFAIVFALLAGFSAAPSALAFDNARMPGSESYGVVDRAGLAATLNWRLTLGGAPASANEPRFGSLSLSFVARQRRLSYGPGIEMEYASLPLFELGFARKVGLDARFAGQDIMAAAGNAEDKGLSPWIYVAGIAVAGGLTYLLLDIVTTGDPVDEPQ